MSLFVNPVVVAALDGLSERQRVIARNVANLQTPGYTAQTVSFEDALAAAVGDDGSVDYSALPEAISYGTSGAAPDLNGNNVSLEDETLNGTETNLKYQLALRAVEGRFNAMRDVLRST